MGRRSLPNPSIILRSTLVGNDLESILISFSILSSESHPCQVRTMTIHKTIITHTHTHTHTHIHSACIRNGERESPNPSIKLRSTLVGNDLESILVSFSTLSSESHSYQVRTMIVHKTIITHTHTHTHIYIVYA